MKNFKQKLLMTFGILLTFGLVAAARPALPTNAAQILTGEVAVVQEQDDDDREFFAQFAPERPLRQDRPQRNRDANRVRR